MEKNSHLIAGIADSLRCVGLIRASTIATKNRLAFLTMDSVLEISLRIYLRHKKRITLDHIKHRQRSELIKIAKKNLAIDASIWDQLTYCYENIRCPLYHEASDMTVTDAMLDDYSETVCFVVNQMFGFDGAECITQGQALNILAEPQPISLAINPNLLQKVDAIVLSLGIEPRPDSSTILTHLRSLGYTGKLSSSVISTYLSQGKYFHRDPSDGYWKLTELVGKKRYQGILEISS